MVNDFKLESELVDIFLKKFPKFSNEITIKEMPIRFGNIDIVSIQGVDLPFSNRQIVTLSKPSCALVFTKIKNIRPISKQKLIMSIGLSESTLNHVLYELINSALIIKIGDNFVRKEKFIFPKTIITGYEAKLKDFNKAFYQAKGNKDYVDYSYLVFPKQIALKILIKKSNLLISNNIGLIGVDDENCEVLLKAKKIECMNDNIRLLNLAKASMTFLANEV